MQADLTGTISALQLQTTTEAKQNASDLILTLRFLYTFFFFVALFHVQLHQGDLHLSGCYQPVAGKIVFNILEARNLPRVSLLGAISKCCMDKSNLTAPNFTQISA